MGPQQNSLFLPDSYWTPPETLPSLATAKLISVDLETCDPGLKEHGAGWARNEGKIVGISIATDSGHLGYYPIAHEGGGNLDRDLVLRWLREELGRARQPKLFANALYDVGWLLREDVIVAGAFYDVQIAEPLIDEGRRTYRLDALAQIYLGESKDETLLTDAAKAYGVDPKAGLWKLPSRFVGPYAEQDALLPLKIFEKQKEILHRDGLWDLFLMETELLPLLLSMRWRGVRVDVPGAERLRETWLQTEKELLAYVKGQWGEVDPWNPTQIAGAFQLAGLDFPRTPTGLPSFQSEWLEAHPHELPRALAKVRKISKARTVFLESYVLGQARNGRVHAELHPLRSDAGGTVTGRFSCSNPNLQNVPKRDPQFGYPIRNLFLPEQGCEWGSFDYSQQEPRLTVHYASQMNLTGAADAVKFYEQDPDADYHQMVADMAGIPRAQAKTINLGLAYGMGKKKLAATLGLSAADAERLFSQYHQRVPFIRELTQAAARRAATRGEVRTLLGRRCHFSSWEPVDRAKAEAQGLPTTPSGPMSRIDAAGIWAGAPVRRAYTHTALNKVIQGSAADMTKRAMVELWRDGIVPHLQIHDELCLSIEGTRHAERVMDAMKNCVTLAVPVKVDGKAGKTWGAAA